MTELINYIQQQYLLTQRATTTAVESWQLSSLEQQEHPTYDRVIVQFVIKFRRLWKIYINYLHRFSE